MTKKTKITIDLFCGAGGASTGIKMAADALGIVTKNYCVNHWDVAIDTHSANHPNDTHKCAPIESIIPSEFVREREVDLLWASPSCTHHSRAKGGKPRNNQLRAQPNLVLDWLDMLFVRRLVVENVWEFTDWGPLTKDGKPIESLRGECFKAWLAALEARNYIFEYRKLNCADYGDATTRERFFLQAVRRGCGRIEWPTPTHSKVEATTLFGHTEKWRGIKECLDLNNLGTLLSERKKPLAPATMARIVEGLKKFHGDRFLIDFLQSGKSISPDSPIRTQHTHDRFAVATPYIVKLEKNVKSSSIDTPISTQTQAGKFCLASAVILPQHSPARTRSIEEPAPTICTAGAISIATPLILDTSNGGKTYPAEVPLNTLTTKASQCLVAPVTYEGVIVDVFFRMLTPTELKLAHGFPAEYTLCGTKADQVKQIGNAVPTRTAKAIATMSLAG